MKKLPYVLIVSMFTVAGLSAPASAQLLGTELLDLDSSGDGSIGVPGVVELQVSSNQSGTTANADVLGGGGQNLSVPLGGSSGVNVDLPGLGGLLGGNDGQPGTGSPGSNGGTTIIIAGTGGGAGGSVGSPGGGANGIGGISSNSRLMALARIMQNRAWMRFAQGNRICLPAFGVANVGSIVGSSNSGGLQRLVDAYGSDIATLQQMLRRCRNGQQQALDIDRVVGVDFSADGRVTVYSL